jgi:hypothetical protein
MAMTLADVAVARKAVAVARQAAYEQLFNALKTANTIDKKAAKQLLGDISDEDDVLNQIEGMINLIAALP